MAIEAIGNVTHDGYRITLIPKAEAMMARGPIRTLYVGGEELAGFEREAPWDDTVFGFKHRHDFIRIAMVTGREWLRAAVKVRLFALSEIAAAKDWVTGTKSGCATRTSSNTRTLYHRNEGKTGS